MKRTALITGASMGIGYEMALQLAAMGVDLVLVARSHDKLQQLAADLRAKHGIRVTVLAHDLSQYHHALTIFNECQQQGIVVDYLINNAGFGDFGFFHQSHWPRQEQMINLNITALAYLTRLFLPYMVQRGSGRILNIASTAAFVPGPLMSVYYATKAFVLSFSEAISNELEGTGVTVTCLCPGPTESHFAEAATAQETNLFKNRKLPAAASVAAYGIKAMFRGQRIAMPALRDRLLIFGNRLVPRSWVLKGSRMILGK